jgi:hypothetical protein
MHSYFGREARGGSEEYEMQVRIFELQEWILEPLNFPFIYSLQLE